MGSVRAYKLVRRHVLHRLGHGGRRQAGSCARAATEQTERRPLGANYGLYPRPPNPNYRRARFSSCHIIRRSQGFLRVRAPGSQVCALMQSQVCTWVMCLGITSIMLWFGVFFKFFLNMIEIGERCQYTNYGI